MSGELVLVTGGSGFVGAHSIVQLLGQGFRVRTTVRSAKREDAVRAMLRTAGIETADQLSFAVADLGSDDGWAAAVEGCEYVLHVASPFPPTQPKDENELIIPARDGALRVLRAARDAGVKRVVLTSSFAAIGYGRTARDRTFTEQDWTDLNGSPVSPYGKSKTIAERSAWEFIEQDGGALQLAVVNPVGILGPVLGADLSSSILLVQRLLDRSMPALPRLSWNLVDVRDVADLHIRAMTAPGAAGERFMAVAGDSMWMSDIAKVLKDRLGPAGARVPTRELPNPLVHLLARVNPEVRTFIAELGKVKRASGEKARTMLGWQPRSNEDAILATAESLIGLGLVKGSK